MKKYKIMLLKEIRKIQNKEKCGKWVFGLDDDFMNASNYLVILKNKTAFYVLSGTNGISPFKFNDVVYVKKEFIKSSGATCIDSNNGYMCLTRRQMMQLNIDMLNKYNVKTIVKYDDWS